jgi:hypothetical protein
VHALDVRPVDAAGRIVRASRIQQEEPPRVLGRVEQAVHARVDHDAAARIAGAGQVRMRVPQLRGVDPVPGRLDQLVLGEAARQARKAGIPQPLLGPPAPGGERAGAGERRAAEEKTASVQGFRRASS